MGRSQQTFNKKENEKKKQKKKKDKEKKKEDRKVDSDKGKSVEEMYAYVDENGNITSTPPDPSRKSEINAEDIVLGVSKREDVEEETLRTGSVTFFNDSKGYGFIKDLDTQESIFVHINNLIGPIKEGNRVTFETERGPRGLNAINVKLSS
jgi:cold shock CspA family protein